MAITVLTNSIGTTERRLGNTILSTYRTEADYLDVLPNLKQPRLGPKEDVELQREIEANKGIFEPLLVEPHPEDGTKYRIIDGERRRENSRVLVEVHKKDEYRKLPLEVVNRSLTDEERWRVWIYIHRQRKEWETKEKEMAAVSLVKYTNRVTAANILGITVRELDKLCDIYELSEKITNLPDPSASITHAREIKNISTRMRTPAIENALVRKINEGLITNSKEIRKVRQILADEQATKTLLKESATIADAMAKIAPEPTKTDERTLSDEIAGLTLAIRSRPWTQVIKLKGDKELVKRISDAESVLHDLRKTLAAS